ncbi:putative ER-associated proteolytic system protein Der1 [Tothia fuscella]|uniref:Derlin n=1 Tax=Tothia fuscella TaxID=1048955 RepID=A0A9P4NS86_9PEZI|nr:putative ER-associated proteolytic system protein Der1 [Tothia fuscella]
MRGGGLGNGFPLEQWFWEMPPITRWWTTSAVLCGILVQCHVLSPFNLFYSIRAVQKGQYWRLLSTFLYFGPLNLDFIFHIFFLQRYSRLTEEASGRSPARFAYLLTFAAISLLCVAPLASLAFLGMPLSSVLVYIWSRRNPDTLLSFMGLLVFKAPWLPWVLMGFSFAVHGAVPKEEICGAAIGHVWYYFNDIYPPTHNGQRPMDPPGWWVALFEGAPHIEENPDTDLANVQGEFAAAAAPEVH